MTIAQRSSTRVTREQVTTGRREPAKSKGEAQMGEVTAACEWKGNLEFKTNVRGHQFTQDVKESNKGPTPKEYALAGVCGCTGMDVASILKTMRQELESLEVSAQAPTTEGQPPSVFSHIHLVFNARGSKVAPEKLMRAIELSQTKHCGVSAMFFRSGAPISYEAHLNGTKIGEGKAEFAPVAVPSRS